MKFKKRSSIIITSKKLLDHGKIPISLNQKNEFTRVAKHQMCSKYHILHNFAQICARAKTDIAPDLLSLAMTVNATFVQHLHLGAKIMGSHRFEGHLQMVQMCRQICFFELCLHITQMIALICCFAQLLL